MGDEDVGPWFGAVVGGVLRGVPAPGDGGGGFGFDLVVVEVGGPFQFAEEFHGFRFDHEIRFIS